MSDIHLNEVEEVGNGAGEGSLGIVEMESQLQRGEAVGVGVDGDGQGAEYLVVLAQILHIILAHVPAAGQAEQFFQG